MPTYGRFDVSFVRGEGATLYGEDGREYIDFASGIGVNSVGYAHPDWVKAVSAQAGTLAHVSNLYHTLPGAKLAERLCALSGMEKVFFANSGAEANEGLIKCARKYSHDKYGEGRAAVVTLVNSFHGRTVTTLAATGQESFHQHFMPFTGGFRHVPAGDLEALQTQPGDVCAVLLELVQGEGGVLPLDKEYVQSVAGLCRKNDWLLCVDEVQTGIARTGTWFAFQQYGIKPDIVSFAKGIAGGLPLGGFMTGEKTSDVLTPGTHATTFGANPVCCAAALATLDILEGVLSDVGRKAGLIRAALEEKNPENLAGIRGLGLMIGLSVKGAPRDYAQSALDKGLVVLTAGKDAVRLLPPLTISEKELEKGLKILCEVLL
ncbi:MAG: aspartate aminotransferase family protein [Oscillospiraceae bacterium]|jgi:acetylornithine/N-succinyldiaminopimelate aminotransferase|nr:aspartate aminotransferase family protein [Oscillospiraceae bacterium]